MDEYPLTVPSPEDAAEERPVETMETDETVLPEPIDLNTATKTELVSLPHIGRILAQRIIEARPLRSLDDLAAVRGISPATIEALRPLVKVSWPESAADEPAPEEDFAAEAVPEAEHPIRLAADSLDALEEAILGEEEAEETPPQAAEEAEAAAELERLEEAVLGQEDTEDLGTLPPLPEQPEAETPPASAEVPPAEETEPSLAAEAPPAQAASPGISRAHAWWLAFASSLVTLILAIIFSLAVLAGINNGLRYAGPEDIRGVLRQVNSIEQTVGSLQQDVDGLRNRLDGLNALAGRVDSLETQTAGLWDALDALDESLSGMEENLNALDETTAALQTEVDELTQQQGAFQTFFQELGGLIDEFFAGQGEGETAPVPPASTPAVATATPTVTPSVTPVP